MLRLKGNGFEFNENDLRLTAKGKGIPIGRNSDLAFDSDSIITKRIGTCGSKTFRLPFMDKDRTA